MHNEHRSYSHPTITEVACNIHFRLSPGKMWKPSFPGEIFKKIQHIYPEMEPVLEMGLQFELGPLGPGTKLAPQRQSVRFKHATRPLILQLSENTCSISALPPYQGWQQMSQDVLQAWQQLVEVLQPEVINRIGLRYINQIEKETEKDRPATWLTANDHIPHAILQSEAGFLLREEIHLDLQNLLIITVGDTKQDSPTGYGFIIFDIDRITEQEQPIAQETLAQAIDHLHTDIWNVFSSAKGEKLETLLNRSSQ